MKIFHCCCVFFLEENENFWFFYRSCFIWRKRKQDYKIVFEMPQIEVFSCTLSKIISKSFRQTHINYNEANFYLIWPWSSLNPLLLLFSIFAERLKCDDEGDKKISNFSKINKIFFFQLFFFSRHWKKIPRVKSRDMKWMKFLSFHLLHLLLFIPRSESESFSHTHYLVVISRE